MNRLDTQNNPTLGAATPFKIGVLHNPLSGGNHKCLQRIRSAAAVASPEVLQQEVQTPLDVSETLADFARREVNIVVINGGDGTVQAALTALFHKNCFETMPLLAVLRSAGTTSMIAGDIGLKGSRLKALRRLFSWARTKKKRRHHDAATGLKGPGTIQK